MKNWKEYVQESLDVKKIKWRYPTDKELEEEFQEPDIDSLILGSGYPTSQQKKDGFQLFKNNLTTTIIKPSQLNKKNSGRFIFTDFEKFEALVTSYGGAKNPRKLVQAINNSEDIPMVSLIKLIDGSYLLSGGATRTAIAHLSNQPIKAVVFDEKVILEKHVEDGIVSIKEKFKAADKESQAVMIDMLKYGVEKNPKSFDNFIKNIEKDYNIEPGFTFILFGIALKKLMDSAEKIDYKIKTNILK